MKEKKINLYLINVLATMLILPLACIIAEAVIKTTQVSWPLIGKYFIFWAIGVRLLMRPVAAITGGLYFGLAGLLHVFRAPASLNETIAKVSDLFIFGVVLLYLCFGAIL